MFFLSWFILLSNFIWAQAPERIIIWGDEIVNKNIHGDSRINENLSQDAQIDIIDQKTQNLGFYIRGSSFNLITLNDVPLYDVSAIEHRILMDTWMDSSLEAYEVEHYPIEYGSLAASAVVRMSQTKNEKNHLKLRVASGETGSFSAQQSWRYLADKKLTIKFNTMQSKGFAVADQKDAKPKSSEDQSGELSYTWNYSDDSVWTWRWQKAVDKSELIKAEFADSEDFYLQAEKDLFSWQVQNKNSRWILTYLKNKRLYLENEITDALYQSQQSSFYYKNKNWAFFGRHDEAETQGQWEAYSTRMPRSDFNEANLTYKNQITQGENEWGYQLALGSNSIESSFSSAKLVWSHPLSSDSLLDWTLAQNQQSPSLYQLFDPQFGNENLKMQRAWHTEVRWQKILQQTEWQAAVFASRFQQLIDFQDNHYRNYNCAEAQGLEVGVKNSSNILVHEVGVSYSEYKDCETKEKISGRAPGKLNYNIQYIFSDRSQYIGQILWVSPRKTSTHDLASYELANLIWQYEARKDLFFKTSVKNIFDRKYRLIRGYMPEPRTLFLQAEYQW